MPKIASSPSPRPELQLPKLDLDALFGLQKANLATVHEAQNVLADAAQAIAKAQYGYVEDVLTGTRSALSSNEERKPAAVLAEIKAAVEKAVAVAKQNVDLGVAAQRRVVELVTRRAQANVNELKAFAA